MSRMIERRLFVFVLLLSLAGAVLVCLGCGYVFTYLVYGGMLALAAFLVHWLLSRLNPEADAFLFPIALLLNGFGLLLLFRFAGVVQVPLSQLKAQCMWTLLGWAALLATVWAMRHLIELSLYPYVAGALGIILLFSAIAFGREVHGARLWVQFGAVRFQPSELAKICLVVFLAGYLKWRRGLFDVEERSVLGLKFPSPRYLGPMVLMWLLSLVLLVAQRDLGMALLFFGIFIAMLYVATGQARLPLVGLLLFAIGAWGCYHAFGHVRTRIEVWLNPWQRAETSGYQIVQALFAIAGGGLTGRGLGGGMSQFIPAVTTDIPFAAVVEETGLLGGVAILLLYLLFFYRTVVISARAQETFTSLLTAGLGIAFFLQVLIIVGGVTKLIPLTGITLPFLSYGGSSLVTNYILLGLLLASGHPHPNPNRPLSNPPIYRLTLLFSLAVLAITFQLTYWQTVRGRALANDPHNPRAYELERKILRGTIYDADGRKLAVSIERPVVQRDREMKRVEWLSQTEYRRQYPMGSLLAHAVGYSTFRLGRSGLEASLNDELMASDELGSPALFTLCRLCGKALRGHQVKLSLDADVQKAAVRALGRHRGAVVAIEPKTGAVRALVSVPAFDPNSVAKNWERLRCDPSAPLLNRATQGLYPPGSVFKVVTASAALESGAVTPETTFTCAGRERVGGVRTVCFKQGGHGKLTLFEGIAKSCNICLAKVAVQTGAVAFEAQAKKFGLNQRIPLEIPVSISRMPTGVKLTPNMLAACGFGQGELMVTPFQMALVACAVATGGEIMRPYLVEEVQTASAPSPHYILPLGSGGYRGGEQSGKTFTLPLKRAISEETARKVKAMMKAVMQPGGTGSRLRVAGLSIAAKTGTAENPRGRAHAWFIAFAPADDPKIAVAVVVEHGGMGGRVAGPIAIEVIKAVE